VATKFAYESRIRNFAKNLGVRVSSDALSTFVGDNGVVAGIVTDAARRAKANGRKTIKAQDVAPTTKPASDKFLYESRVRDSVKVHGLRCAGDALSAVNAMSASRIEDAAARAKANGRKTIQPGDF
jgi:histone H3/H4